MKKKLLIFTILALIFSVLFISCGDKAVVGISIVDEDGTPLDKERMPIIGDLKVALPEGASFLTRNLIMNFQGLRFEKVGTYAINVTLDGELVASTPLRLVMVQGEQA